MFQKVAGLLRREFRFLHKPLNLVSRCFLLAAAVAIAASFFFPLWKMHLVAPQYSDGLDLYIFSHKIVGGGLTAVDVKDLIFTSQPAGSFVSLMAVNEATTDSAWVITAIRGVATKQA